MVVEASTVFSRLCVKVCLLCPFLCPYYSFRSELESKSGIATSPFKRSHLVLVPHMLIQLPHGLDRWSREPSAPLRLKHWRELEAWSIWWVSEAILARASLSVCLKHTAASQ